MNAVAYMGSPVAGDIESNLANAMAWLRFLRTHEPELAIIAPWIAAILSGEDDNDPEQRARGLRDCCATASLCAGIVLVGGRISSGMQRELDAVQMAGGWVSDLTSLGPKPPPFWPIATRGDAVHTFPVSYGRWMWRSNETTAPMRVTR